MQSTTERSLRTSVYIVINVYTIWTLYYEVQIIGFEM